MSEKTIGKWLKSRNLRSRIVVSTKGGFPHLENYHISRLVAQRNKERYYWKPQMSRY